MIRPTTATLFRTTTIGVRGALAAALLVAATACSTAPTAPTAPAAQLVSEAGLQAKTPAAPTLFAGTWYQDPVMTIPQPGGGVAEATVRLQLTQKGTTITGEARRFLSTWDVNGNPLLVSLDQGSPGKVTGTVSGSNASLLVRDFLETKLTVTLALTVSADGTRLSTASANTLAISGFRR